MAFQQMLRNSYRDADSSGSYYTDAGSTVRTTSDDYSVTSSRSSNQLLDRVQRRAGDRVGMYSVKGMVGSGGFGDVYNATPLFPNRLAPSGGKPAPEEWKRSGANEVALKIIVPHDRDDTLDENIEVCAHRRCGPHPNIVGMHDEFEFPAPLHWSAGGPVKTDFALVFQFVQGVNLGEALDDVGMPVSETVALHVGLQVSRALTHLHARGVAHRDLKPCNIMLEFESEYAEWLDTKVRLVDLGLAFLWDVKDPSTNWTTTVAGTPGYVPPDMGKETRKTPAKDDVYSLGVVLYEMLSGALAGDPTDNFQEKEWRYVSADMKELIRICLMPSFLRPTAEDVNLELTRIAKKAGWYSEPN